MLSFLKTTKGLFVALSLFFYTISTNAQSKQALISSIDKTTKYINQYQTTKISAKKTVDGNIQGYRNAKEWVKIVKIKTFPTGKETFTYYFKNGTLIYILEIFDTYKEIDTLTGKHSTQAEKTFEGHYYFQNNKLIDINTIGHNRFENDAIDPESTLLKEAKFCKNTLNKK